MSGGGGFKKVIINFVIDKPVQAYIGGGATMFLINKYRARSAYNYHFGKFDFERRLERNTL